MSEKPLLTVLNFSGGTGSSAILWMVLRGEIEMPDNFVVLNADPGMERRATYAYIERMKKICEEKGIYFETVPGPNLYEDLINLKSTDKTRLDNPPYWTKDPKTGKEGMLRQKCTQYYKIAPMDRAIRVILEERFGISRRSKRLGSGIVEKWIGFTADEVMRIKPSAQKYVRFAYPLIDIGMTKEDLKTYFEKNNLPLPPRSVCNACFANGLNTYRDMFYTEPEDWGQAVEVDRAVRDLTQIGIREEVYVSKTLTPLEELAKNNFTLGGSDDDDFSCDSGYCFV